MARCPEGHHAAAKTDETIHSLVRNSDAAARYGNGEMCEKCVEIDAKIERYRNTMRSITDQPTVDGTKALIADLEAQKPYFIRNESSEPSLPLALSESAGSQPEQRSLVRGTIKEEPDWLSTASNGSYNNTTREIFRCPKAAE
jgi:hypothetical protein